VSVTRPGPRPPHFYDPPDSPSTPSPVPSGSPVSPRSGLPAVSGILTASDVLTTGEHLAAVQEPSGAISWPDGHTNAWDHVECAMALSVCGLTAAARRAYDWLRRTQRADGSWPRRTVAETVTDPAAESNQAAYVAVGTWHEFLITGDHEFARQMWPTVYRAIEFVLALQTARGEIVWERTADGTAASFALLAGCSSTYQSLRCAIQLADCLGEPQPGWELAASRLRHVIADHPEAFADKSRFSMDWYYPVLAGPISGPAAANRLNLRWSEFVVPGLGVRCVSDQPWVTGAETCELVIAAIATGDHSRALEVFADIQHLRDPDGGYWTGWQYVNKSHFPAERSSWTAAAIVLAADALSGTSKGSGLFRDVGVEDPANAHADPAVCGCTVIATG
jgi:MMP endo-(1,4)-3-O-methyl-alpha-D-mannosidase